MKYSQSICAINSYTSLETIDELVKNGMKHIHVDFMDSFYVPNFGVSFEAAEFLIKRYPNVNFDAHLMVKNPLRLIERLVQVGFETIFLPAKEINKEEFDKISQNYPNVFFGIMLEANNDPNDFRDIVLNSKKILLMTINKIGGTGQKLDENLFKKVEEIKKINPEILIYSDGGLRQENTNSFYNNKIDVAVGGSIIWSFETIKDFLEWWNKKYA